MPRPAVFRCAGSGSAFRRILLFNVLGCLLLQGRAVPADDIKRIEPDTTAGTASAVVVSGGGLLHTTQIFPAADALSMAASDQFGNVVSQMTNTISQNGASEIVKLNLYVVSDAAAAEVLQTLPAHFPDGQQPAVAVVVSSLPVKGALVAADAVAFIDAQQAKSVQRSSQAAVLPEGSRIYISGQAHQSESLGEATAGTLLSLHKTLEFLGRSDDDIVQLKAFVEPMSDHAVVSAEVTKFFHGRTVPPLVLVEWKSSKTVPVEIELIAVGGAFNPGAPAMEFLTPTDMTASPVYCRVCRINSAGLIYVSGLYSQHDTVAHPQRDANGDVEVLSVFESLERILKQAGSDFRHLAKATYYVATDSTSASLNKLRPNYYDPMRPPAASKAAVTSVGRPEFGLTLDMIAVPATP